MTAIEEALARAAATTALVPAMQAAFSRDELDTLFDHLNITYKQPMTTLAAVIAQAIETYPTATE